MQENLTRQDAQAASRPRLPGWYLINQKNVAARRVGQVHSGTLWEPPPSSHPPPPLYYTYPPNPADRGDWRASPLTAATLEGAPPAFVLTVGHDPLCSEGQLYAARLEREGVPVTALHLSDQTHGMLNLGKIVRTASTVLDIAAAALREAWRP